MCCSLTWLSLWYKRKKKRLKAKSSQHDTKRKRKRKVTMCRPDEDIETKDDDKNENEKNQTKIVYTEEELEAMRRVKRLLMGLENDDDDDDDDENENKTKLSWTSSRKKNKYNVDESKIGNGIFLAMTTINCKLRVDEAAKKFQKLLDIMEECGVPEGFGVSPLKGDEKENDEEDETTISTNDNGLWIEEAAYQLSSYAPTGPNYDGASTIWIRGNVSRVSIDEERHHTLAGTMFILACHADSVSLRQGVTFVIDTTIDKSSLGPKVGNEGKLQKLYQSYPLRPQQILIAGTNMITRVIVNTAIQVASLFTKQKVLDRIEFITLEQAKTKIPLSSVPVYLGGEGGGNGTVINDWVKQRLEQFPIPEL